MRNRGVLAQALKQNGTMGKMTGSDVSLTMIKTYSFGSSAKAFPSDFFPALKKFDHLVTPSEPDEADFLFVDERQKSLREMFPIPDRGQIRGFGSGGCISGHEPVRLCTDIRFDDSWRKSF
jgi:hypothetical protein